MTILLVEDDEVDVMNVKRAFKKNNISNPLIVASNGIEALEVLRSGSSDSPKPRIVLLDLNMPRMGGIEFLKEIRQDPELSSLSVFVMTTSNEDSDKIEAFNLNVAGYILKPLSMDRFISAVSTLNSYWTLCEYPG
ncbi:MULTISPECIES: response regulator [Dyadobacter]|jgi:CheY-like chemotaxis protein|uniref:Response regulator n=1 Tax=Dyadobacter chenhuakuii TaxID=2909339 RepID=A0A9X1QE59_9BACT|nr:MULTISPECIES: response regulator [Dyadobacter]MCE7073218.1 response regulator [Dyadobacter sp. CY327]MCF2496247.1 response regulator [Dyadobacter chenhuakuii]MCF2499681.1 response regulator [Dyadobacter chenhuakuii]MCF2520591.1 response regulator [Dyadobacter sp. CY351]USJ30308.1 response regulator [Dyadobacter chenhuakuii]